MRFAAIEYVSKRMSVRSMAVARVEIADELLHECNSLSHKYAVCASNLLKKCFALAVVSAAFTTPCYGVKVAQGDEPKFTFLFPATPGDAWQGYVADLGETLANAGLERAWQALPANVLAANWSDVLEALESGMVELAAVPAAALAERASAFSVLDLPLAFTSIEEGRAFVTGDAGQIVTADQILTKAAAEEGFMLLGYTWQLDTLILIELMDGCAAGPDAMMGRKVRARDPEYVELLQAAGAAVVPLPALEVFPALERGLIDAALLPADVALNIGLAEVAKCLISPRPNAFAMTPYVILAREDVVEALPAPVKRALNEAVATVEAAEDQRQHEVAAALAEAFHRSGGRVQPLTDSAFAEWSALAADTVYARFAASAGPEEQKLLELAQ